MITRRAFLKTAGAVVLLPSMGEFSFTTAAQNAPLELLWLLPSQPLNEQTRPTYLRVATDETFSKIDAFSVLTFPPTFESYNETFIQAVRDLVAVAQRPMIYATFTVGTEGWETSNNARMAQALGISFHPERNLHREQWFEQMRLVQMGLWGLTIESLTRVPTANEVRDYILAFARAAHSNAQKAAVWYTANWERFRPAGAIVQSIFRQAAPELDHVVWMDTRSLLEDQGEAGVRRRVQEIVALTGEKTIFQVGFFGPDAFAKARQFMKWVQEEGVHRFALFISSAGLASPEWAEFYGELRR